jgi:hypothetical protein
MKELGVKVLNKVWIYLINVDLKFDFHDRPKPKCFEEKGKK